MFCSHAMHLLREGGFSPRLNGEGLLVPVQHEHKAVPLRMLAAASIAVDDFDLRSHGAHDIATHAAEDAS